MRRLHAVQTLAAAATIVGVWIGWYELKTTRMFTEISVLLLLTDTLEAERSDEKRGVDAAFLLERVVRNGIDVKGLDASGVDLSHADLRGGDFGEATFKDSNLSHVDFRGSHLRHADFNGANVSDADFGETDIDLAQLREACTNRQSPPKGIDADEIARLEQCESRTAPRDELLPIERTQTLDFTGDLGADETADQTVDLRTGGQYGFLGTCGAACSDIDLELRAPNGDLVDYDYLVDDVPLITYSPTTSGKFQIRVLMVSCADDRCSWAVRMAAREAAESAR